jgi:hypothetical protein
MWVVQEAALADLIRVRYEGVEMQWIHLVTAFELLINKQPMLGGLLLDGLISEPGCFVSTKSPRPIASATLPPLFEIRRRIQSGEDRPLAVLLTWLRGRKVEDLKDKILCNSWNLLPVACAATPSRLQ